MSQSVDGVFCPRCGEPPRYRRAVCVVKRQVGWDRALGKLVEGEVRHVGKPLPDTEVTWECGGGHVWSHPDPGVGVSRVSL